uniref:Uncharacterized protein n=1 Tax=Arundo donax TaxID=35708 RepID=A0A0A9AE40_ARUDO
MAELLQLLSEKKVLIGKCPCQMRSKWRKELLFSVNCGFSIGSTQYYWLYCLYSMIPGDVLSVVLTEICI